MNRLAAFALAAWDFIVGDDWRTAIGIAIALSLTALVADAGIPAWWLMPAAVLVLLALSVRRAARQAARRE
jgi:hypothetical protein